MIKNILAVLFLLSSVFAQNEIWDMGELSFNYGYPIPNESISYSGSIVPDTVSHQGYFAFKTFVNDTATYINLAYETEQLDDSTTVMDIFLILIRQEGDIELGNYPVNLNLDEPTLFLWLLDLDAENFVGLIDSLMSNGDITQTDATIISAVSGDITLNELTSSSTSGTFQGTTVSSDVSFLLVQDGTFSANRTIPSPQYTHGELSFDGFVSFDIQGAYVPIVNDQGVGGQSQITADTAGVGILGFYSHSLDSIDIVFASIVTTNTDEFASGASFPITNSSLEGAQFGLIQGMSMSEFINNAQQDTQTDSINLENTYVGVSGFLTLDYLSEQQIQLSADSILLEKQSDNSLYTIYNYYSVCYAPEVSAIEVSPYFPETIEVGAAYPNPFNGTTVLPLKIKNSEYIEIKVYDILGREVFAQSHFLTEGKHDLKIDFTNRNLSSGWYMIQAVQAENPVGMATVLFIK